MNINVVLSKKSVLDIGAKSIVYFLPEKFHEKDLSADVKKHQVANFLKENNFTGAKGSQAVLPVSLDGKEFTYLYFAGLGDCSKKVCVERLRRAIGSAVMFAKNKNLASIAFELPAGKKVGLQSSDFIAQMYTIAMIAGYKFDQFKSKSPKEKEKELTITLCVDASDVSAVKEGEHAGSVIAQAVNRTRLWIDTPPSKMNPTDLANLAQKLAKEKGLSCTIFDEKKIIQMGMGGLAGVSAGSDQEARFVILEYKAKKAKAETIAFVGKGITFDSGGLSIKPAQSMECMKDDMSGAASVINTLAALADLKPDVNVVGIAAITENMPGCRATKPGDILTFYNGKTAEVLNTDAEGRLVLADALSYAVKHYKLSAVIDVATLTGACLYAVGPFFTALLSDNDDLAKRVEVAASHVGDYVWRLPFTEDFKEAVKSPIADIQNIGDSRIGAGTITAAWFLRHFTDEVPWVHLDIASSSFNVPNISYYEKGATGSSVRLMIDLAMNWK